MRRLRAERRQFGLKLVQIGVENLVNFGRHNVVGMVQQQGDVMAGVGL